MMGRLFWMCAGFVAYVYAGYPMILGLLAKLVRRPDGVKERPEGTPPVTLLIAAYNEEAVIGDKLENTLALDYPAGQVQILVAADGSTDGTAEIVARYAERGVELSYSAERRGKMAAINRAMARARGEYVLFSDANNMYDKDVLREMIRPFAEPGVGAVTGSKTVVKDAGALGESEGLYWKYESFIKQAETQLGSCTGAAGEILAIRRQLFEPPPDDIINDDLYMALRLLQRGHRLVYAPKARSYERVSPSAQDEITRRSRIVAGRYQVMFSNLLPWGRPLVTWQIISHKYLRPLVPLAMLGAVASNVMAVVKPSRKKGSLWALSFPFNGLFLALQALFYLLAWAGNQTKLDGRIGKFLYLPAFLLNSNWAALQGLYGYLNGQQTNLWQRVGRHELPLPGMDEV